jgi:hypothetical protein
VREAVKQPRSDRSFLHGLSLAWLLLPLGGVLMLEPNVYDGLRHFLFVLPALGVLAGLGSVTVAGWLQRQGVPRPALAWVTAGALLAIPAWDLVRLHPYQMTYYNGLVGGVGGASGRYQTDYWIASYREGMLWINEQAEQKPDRTFRVLVAGTAYVLPAADHYGAPNVEVVTLDQYLRGQMSLSGFDFCLATTRAPWGAAVRGCGSVVHTVGRAGAAFTEIRRIPSAHIGQGT